MPDNLETYQLARDRARRNVVVPPRASQSEDALATQRVNNERRTYAEIVRSRPQTSNNAVVTARIVVPPLRAPANGRNVSTANVPNGGADSYLERIAARDGNDLRRYFEAGQLSAVTLRNLARVPNRTPSPLNHVSASDPGAVVPVAPAPVPAPIPAPVPVPVPAPAPALAPVAAVGAGPIATDLQGRNAWPGITVNHQAGGIVRSRFSRRGAHNINPARAPTPLRRTDIDTIVPGTPLPRSSFDHGHAHSQPVPNSDAATHGAVSVIPGAATHSQTTTRPVASSQPLPPTTMTSPGPRIRKRPLRDAEPASQSTTGSNGSTSVVTPTPTCTAGTGTGATSTNHNQVHANTVRARAVRTGFNFSNANLSCNATAPVRFDLQANPLNNQPGRPVPLSQPHCQVPGPVVSQDANPFYSPSGGDAPRRPPTMTAGPAPVNQAVWLERPTGFQPPASRMADRPAPTLQTPSGIPQGDVFASPSVASGPSGPAPQAQAPVPRIQVPLPQAPLAVSYATNSSYSGQVAPSAAQAPQHAPVVSQVTQPHAAHSFAPQASSQPSNVGLDVQFLSQQLPALHQVFVTPPGPPAMPLPANAHIVPQAPIVPGEPMEVDTDNEAQGEQGAAGVAAGGAPPGGGPNLPVVRSSVISSYPHEQQPVIRTFVRFNRVWNISTGSYPHNSWNPNDHTPSHDEMGWQCWTWANEEHGTEFPFDPEYMKAADAAVGAARSMLKICVLPLVRQSFDFRADDPEHNKALVRYLLPDRIHCENPEQLRGWMESPILYEVVRSMAFQSTQSIGFRYPRFFDPLCDRILALGCTMVHHCVRSFRHGRYQNENLCAPQQEAVYGNYMRSIESARERTPNRLRNMCVRTRDYCMRSLVDPDPEPEEEVEDREFSPDVEEVITSQFASRVSEPALAPPVQPEPIEHTQQSPVGHVSVASGEGESWEIVTHADGSVFLIGPTEAAQIDPGLVDDLLSLRISPPLVLETAAKASFSPIQDTGIFSEYDAALAASLAVEETLHAGPSGLTAAEKDSILVPSASIAEVTDWEEVLPSRLDKGKGKAKASTLYGGCYLDEYGGVEHPCEGEPHAGPSVSDDFEPVEISDEEMELEPDD